MCNSVRAAGLIAALVLTGLAVVPAQALDKPLAPVVGPNAIVTTTNGILTLSIENSSTSTLGMWSVTTGASHPNPGQQVLYPVGTSYISFRDATASIMYANATGVSAGLAGYTFQNMSAAPGSGVVSVIPGGYRTLWTIPSWTVQQDVVINGTTLTDTNIRQTVTVCNTSAAPRQYGVRFMWDWMIAGADASFFRTRNPDSAFTGTSTTYNSPTFQLFEEVNNIATPLFSVFGTVTGGPLSPAPTAPDQLRYGNWGASYGSAWDYANTGSAGDSSTVHYWGFNAPLTLAAAGCASYTEYLTTNLSAAGGGSTVLEVPTVSATGLLLLVALLGGLALWSTRRKTN